MALTTIGGVTVNNLGRLNNFISGITGISRGGQATLNQPVNLRAHRLNLQTFGIAYQVPTVAFTGGGGTGAAGTVTVVNGVITGVVMTNAGTGYTSVPTVTFTDSNYTTVDGQVIQVGQGATGTAVLTSTTVTSVTITNGGTQTLTPAELVITQIKQLVNGVNMRDISPVEILRIAAACNYEASLATTSNLTTPQGLGQLPIYYTEPARNIVHHNETTSWDLFGQNTWQIIFSMASNVSSPNITGSYEFDAERNTRPAMVNGKAGVVPFLNPVRQHSYTYPVPSGRYDLTILPFNFPITRLWFYSTNSSTGARLGKGSISQLEVYQDGNKILEQTCGVGSQNDEMIAEYGFNPAIYDAAFISDIDQRIQKALKVIRNFLVRVYSTSAGTLNIVQEMLPGSYQ